MRVFLLSSYTVFFFFSSTKQPSLFLFIPSQCSDPEYVTVYNNTVLHSNHCFSCSLLQSKSQFVSCSSSWANLNNPLYPSSYSFFSNPFSLSFLSFLFKSCSNSCSISFNFFIHHHVKKKEERKKGRWNDPSAGSPTETLLRLLLPLNKMI